MPHIEIKISPNVAPQVDVPQLLERLVAELSRFETVKSSAIKAYHVQVLDFRMGQDAPDGFVHCVVSVLSGRPLELRQRMAQSMHAVIKESVALSDISISLELREMESSTYVK